MPIIALALAAAVTDRSGVTAPIRGPEILNPQSLVTPSDYPEDALRKGQGGYVDFAVAVDPAGKVERCDVVRGTGVESLDDLTCRLIVRRARFKPAVDVSGMPTFGLYKSRNAWLVGRWLRVVPPRSADFSLALNQLPDGLKSPHAVSLAVAVDATGAITNCAPSSPKENRTLTTLACSQIVSSAKSDPTRDRSGQPVSSVQLLSFDFSAAPAPVK